MDSSFVILFLFLFLFAIFSMVINRTGSESIPNKKKKQELSALKKLRHLSYAEYDELRILDQDNDWLNLTRKDKEILYQQYVLGSDEEQSKERYDDYDDYYDEDYDEDYDGEDNEPESSKLLPPLSVVESAKIAKQTITFFNSSEIIEVKNLLSQQEMIEAVRELHERLRPFYENKIIDYYANQLKIEKIKLEEIDPQVELCMRQGFQGILKLEELQGLFGEGAEKNLGRTISKTRSWSEISGKSD